MTIDLYMMPGSAPCRSVRLVAAALDLDLTLRPVDLMKGEHLKPEYLKLNPQHTIPTLVDDDFSLWESRAILRYLVNKYGGADNALYPADPKARAVVDQRLDFDLGTIYARFAAYAYPQVFGGQVEEGAFKKLQDALDFLNTFLEGSKYVAGDKLTIADLSLVASISTIDIFDISLSDYPNIVRWYELVKSTAPGYEKENAEPLAEFKAFIDSKKA